MEFLEIVKSPEKKERKSPPPTPAVGTIEVPCLEERFNLELVKSPEKKEDPHPPSKHPPANGTKGLPSLEEGKVGSVVKSFEVKGQINIDVKIVKSVKLDPPQFTKRYGENGEKIVTKSLSFPGISVCGQTNQRTNTKKAFCDSWDPSVSKESLFE